MVLALGVRVSGAVTADCRLRTDECVAIPNPRREGWEGWDEYAPFYDWENARTLGRRDVRFWQDLASRVSGRVLELGCGTGRITVALARSGATVVGIDRSARMLARARRRLARASGRARAGLVRGDVRAAPFRSDTPFDLVIAPYGILQSLLRDEDLDRTLKSVASVLAPGGTFGIDLVADLPAWEEYRRRVRLRGRRRPGGSTVTLIESVRQERRKRLTIFDQEFVERGRGRAVRRRFSLAFRTLSVRQMRRRLERAGFRVSAVLGDYDGRPWDPRADVWIMLAHKPEPESLIPDP